MKLSAIYHLGVVGRDIAAMTAVYTRLGFTPTDPVPLMGLADGQPVPLGQESAHLIFADSYVELSGVTSTDPKHHLAPWLCRREGLHILALGSADADLSHKALISVGLDVPDVQEASRTVTYGTRHGDAKFKWFKAPNSMAGEGFVCMVEQLTPDLVFQPPAEGHPNGAHGVAGVTILTNDPAAAQDRFSTYPGATRIDDHHLKFDQQTLTFIAPAAFAKTYGQSHGLTPPAFA